MGEASARAPGRVNLIGEHTDYNAGLCLPFTIPAATTVTAWRRHDRAVHVVSAQAGRWAGDVDRLRPGSVEDWPAYVAGTLWALQLTGRDLPGLDLEIDSEVPMGSGLSSSAALEAAVAVAVVTLLGEDLDDEDRAGLVTVCRRAETEGVGAPTGGLDQTAVLRSPPGGGLLLDFDDGSVTPVPLPWGDDGLAVIVVDTRVSHAHAGGGYRRRREECELAAAHLDVATLRDATTEGVERLADPVLRRRARHVVEENHRVEAAVRALAARDWAALGALLDASHASLRDDFEVSCAELDLATERLRAAGALGARMTGGGFGGSAIALLPAERVDDARAAVDAGFAAAGFAPPGHLDGTPSGPAHAVRPGAG